LRYSRHDYDYQAGTLVFYASGQLVSFDNPRVVYQPIGFGLLFHPDFLIGTHLGKVIHQYKFLTIKPMRHFTYLMTREQ
jgi:hypothetical protein